MTTTETKGIALITGASSGIGAVYADRLRAPGLVVGWPRYDEVDTRCP